jgi:hypothetical protein
MSDRKYRHRGYQDDGRREERARGGPAPPHEKREGPRGRGLGAPSAEAFRCAACGKKVLLGGEGVALDAACPHCQADLHACANCRHFDSGARFECRQPIPERVPRKRQRNACGLFAAKATVEFAAETRRAAPTGAPDTADDARSAFDALFKF